MKVSKNSVEHHIWGKVCDRWDLMKSEDLSVIHEKMPPNYFEPKHYHDRSKQFFFVLSGQATVVVDNEVVVLNENDGIEIHAKAVHQMRNNSEHDVELLIISSPTCTGDRVDVE